MQTRMQATFEVMKKMSTGLVSPRESARGSRSGSGSGRKEVEVEAGEELGYFDGVPDVVEA